MPQTRYRFGEFELDPASRELWRGTQRIALPPKSFECLAYLIAHRDRAVGRDELISAVWGRVDASDTLVAQTLLRARKALDDTGDRQAMIRTVPRFGYRWVAPVQAFAPSMATQGGTPPAPPVVVDPARPAPAPVTAPPPAAADPARPRRRHAMWVALAAGLLCLAALLIWRGAGWPGAGRDAPAAAAAPRGNNTVLVLPVQLIPSEPETSWIRLGAMDYIASRARRADLRVLPSDQTLHLSAQWEREAAGEPPPWPRLHEASGARWVLIPEASRDARGWRVRLRWDDAGQERMVEAHGSTPLTAAAAATDAWLSRQGRRPPQEAPTALTERVQQVDAELTAGQLATVRRLIEQAPAEQRRDPRLRVRQAQLAYRSGRIEEAQAQFLALLEPVTAVDDVEVRAQALMGLGAVAIRHGDFAQAQARYGQALEALQSGVGTGDPAMLGNAYNGRGVARIEQGQTDAAIHDMGLARIAMLRAGDLVQAAMVGTNLGIMETRRGHYPQALQEFNRAIATYERYGVRDYLAAALTSRARTELALAQNAAALASIDRAAREADALEDQSLAMKVGAVRALVQLRNGALTDARASIARLRAVGLASDDVVLRELALRELLARDRRREAGVLAMQPLAELAPGALALTSVQAALRADDMAGARQWLQRAPAAPDREARVDWELARALVQARDGQRDRGLQRLQALAQATSTGSPDERIRIAVAQALMLLDAGQTQSAAAVLGELDAYADSDYRVAWSMLALYRMLGDATQAERARAQAESLRGERALAAPLVL